jgi:hypothetical protein
MTQRLVRASTGLEPEVERQAQCGAVGVPLLFGLPVPEATAAAVEGLLALVARLMAALSAHDYADPEDSQS